MTAKIARLFVLGTSLIALVSIVVALIVGLRLRDARAEMAELQSSDACPVTAPGGGRP